VRFWLHNEHVMVEGQKMSKSLGNFFTLNDLVKKGHEPRTIRYLLLTTHYRSKLNITDKSLFAAKQAVEKIDNFLDLLKEAKGGKHDAGIEKLVRKAEKEFAEAMDDDLDTGTATAKIFDFMRDVNKLLDEGKIGKEDAEKCLHAMQKFDHVLGVLKKDKGVSKELVEKTLDMLVELHELLKAKDHESAKRLEALLSHMKGKEYDPENFGKLMDVISEVREALRRKKEFALSDKIRADLKEMGIVLEDKESGVRWRII